uniref:Uncharacterized protein n=1 Tax=Coccidioides posadasii RMSCC 3488 TaxID=454284 RepID=A0A0J6F7X3_COCPO|nr:hypothetical protein CPAG_01745 [Coccidioides posadasii RMSCC 3488]
MKPIALLRSICLLSELLLEIFFRRRKYDTPILRRKQFSATTTEEARSCTISEMVLHQVGRTRLGPLRHIVKPRANLEYVDVKKGGFNKGSLAEPCPSVLYVLSIAFWDAALVRNRADHDVEQVCEE